MDSPNVFSKSSTQGADDMSKKFDELTEFVTQMNKTLKSAYRKTTIRGVH